MKALHRICTRLVIVTMVLGLVAACGDDRQPAVDTNSGQENQNDNQSENGAQSEEDCDDDEYWHPIDEECRDDDDGGESGEEDCDPGEEYDADQEECVSKCPVNEIWDEDEQECINASQDCGEFEEWDEEEGVCVPTEECGPGSIVGQSCRPDGGVLPGAQIEVEGVDCDGMEFSKEVVADDQAHYEINDVPAGTHEMTVSSGSWEHTDEVTVFKGEETDLTSEAAKICIEPVDMEIAVFDGTFDDIAAILDGMDIDYDHYTSYGDVSDVIGDIDELMDYDIVFAECSVSLSSGSIYEDNLRAYVNEGNSLYASDLSDEWIERPFPDAVDFASESGSSGTVTADVTSDVMQNLLGSMTTEIYFSLGAWTIAEGVGPATTAHFRADVDGVEDAPLMTQFNDPIGDGRVIYTSFHNTDQPTDDMEDILEYMIFQL